MNHRVHIYNLYHYRSRLQPQRSQRACGQAAGVHPETYGNLERGLHGTTEDVLCRIARVLKVHPDQLRQPLQEGASKSP